MNNLTKALELYVKDAEAMAPPPPVEEFHRELATVRKEAERKAAWRVRLASLAADAWEWLSMAVGTGDQLALEVAGEPAVVASRRVRPAKSQSLGRVRTLVVKTADA